MEDERLEKAAKEGQVAYTNKWIKESGLDTNLISDGYHTFGELYEHRIVLWISLLRHAEELNRVIHPTMYPNKISWRTKVHSDDSISDGWFMLGTGHLNGKQITYHLPMEYWDQCDFSETLDKAPEFDGHTSKDVLERLKNL